MSLVIDDMSTALDGALTELYWLHHTYGLPKDSKATAAAEKAAARFQREVINRRYREARAKRRPS